MTLWLLAVGEPLPSDEGTPRLLRVGLVAGQAARRGLQVHWWTSAFDHTHKRMRTDAELPAPDALGYHLHLLKGRPYAANVSWARVRNHRDVAADFAARASAFPPPDAIFCAYPTIELCEAALQYAAPRGIPVVVDVRDLWPDIFVNLVPSPLRPLARLALTPMMRASRRACAGANAITGITEAFVDWGAARAGRARSPHDRAFPLAYQAAPPDPAALQSARLRWREAGLVEGRPIACFFGTLGRQFDIPMLIEAARLLADSPLRIVVCGAGDRLDDFRQLAADVPNIVFPGWVDAAAIHALMERSLAGLAPYHCEHSFTLSVPNKAIEYLAGGLPVVSTLQGQLASLLSRHRCGRTVPEGRPDLLATALRELLADPGTRQEMADNARRTYEEQFVAEVVYGRLIDHLCGMARSRRDASGAASG